MNDGPTGPRAGDILGGVVLILFGLCILLVGGGCTILWLSVMFADRGMRGSDGGFMLVISIVAAAAGLFAIVKGVQIFRGKYG